MRRLAGTLADPELPPEVSLFCRMADESWLVLGGDHDHGQNRANSAANWPRLWKTFELGMVLGITSGSERFRGTALCAISQATFPRNHALMPRIGCGPVCPEHVRADIVVLRSSYRCPRGFRAAFPWHIATVMDRYRGSAPVGVTHSSDPTGALIRGRGMATGTARDLAAAKADLVGRQPAYRQPSAGATWVRMLSMTWAL